MEEERLLTSVLIQIFLEGNSCGGGAATESPLLSGRNKGELFIHHICNNICNVNAGLIVCTLRQAAAKGHMTLRVVTAPMATLYCGEHAAAFTIMRNPFVDKATTKPSITASTLPIHPKYISPRAAPFPPAAAAVPHLILTLPYSL